MTDVTKVTPRTITTDITKVIPGQNVTDITKVIWKRSHRGRGCLISGRSDGKGHIRKNMADIRKVTSGQNTTDIRKVTRKRSDQGETRHTKRSHQEKGKRRLMSQRLHQERRRLTS